MRTPTEFSSTDLRVLQQQLAQWRQAQTGRPRLPPDVWEAASVLAHRHRPSSVARVLGLSYRKLVPWMSRTGPKIPAALEPARFVELKWSPPTDTALEPVGWAEFRDASDRVLRLHTGHYSQAWLALADSFWRQGR
ncbi:MAG: hypothetical protein RIS76_3001 [Verrucomicrobiota bacterium]|jgi:hypothetical protein